MTPNDPITPLPAQLPDVDLPDVPIQACAHWPATERLGVDFRGARLVLCEYVMGGWGYVAIGRNEYFHPSRVPWDLVRAAFAAEKCAVAHQWAQNDDVCERCGKSGLQFRQERRALQVRQERRALAAEQKPRFYGERDSLRHETPPASVGSDVGPPPATDWSKVCCQCGCARDDHSPTCSYFKKPGRPSCARCRMPEENLEPGASFEPTGLCGYCTADVLSADEREGSTADDVAWCLRVRCCHEEAERARKLEERRAAYREDGLKLNTRNEPPGNFTSTIDDRIRVARERRISEVLRGLDRKEAPRYPHWPEAWSTPGWESE